VRKIDHFDLTYVTIDSIAEGVGSSQISPLITLLSKDDMKINLISFEKSNPSNEMKDYFMALGVNWDFQHFGESGLFGGIERLSRLRRQIPNSKVIHARSDIPAVGAINAHQGPVLWDVRSLWADQKVLINESLLNKALYKSYRKLERNAAQGSLGMSTLTNAVIPVLESRNGTLPLFRTVVPTAVNLQQFKLSPMITTGVRALFSGTYNSYYDMDLSFQFMQELGKILDVETHWARPAESSTLQLNVGESKIFLSKQSEMSRVIPEYSFGVSICRLDAGPSLSAAMPTKIAEFLACGRPVIVNKGLGDVDMYIEEFDAGVVLDGTKHNLVEGATKLAHILKDSGTSQRCRELAEKYFNMETGARKYINLYSQIINSAP
jgi:hypothetical protein